MLKILCDLCGKETRFPVEVVEWHGIKVKSAWNEEFNGVPLSFKVSLDVIHTTNKRGVVPQLCGECFNRGLWAAIGGKGTFPGSIKAQARGKRGLKPKTAIGSRR